MKQEPPFCPNTFCSFHHPSKSNVAYRIEQKKWYIRKGWRPLVNGQRIQRYQCKNCNRIFSDRTFSIDYWEKRHLDYKKLLMMLVSCMSLRSLSRIFICSPKTIENKLNRLTRQAIAAHSLLKDQLDLQENLTADGFESFTVSQYFPNNFNLLVGKNSQFVYNFNYSQLRRKGRMTEAQRSRSEKLKKEVPIASGEIINRFAELIDEALRLQRRSSNKHQLKIYTDEREEYASILSRSKFGLRSKSQGFRVFHHRTNSREPRNRSNPLFSVNYIDREIRKDLAEHVRESTRFGKNVNSAVCRMELYLFYHNYIKPFRINRRLRVYNTHAEAAGIQNKKIKKIMHMWIKRRFFLSHTELDLHSQKVWFRAYSTPGKWFTDVLPNYVFA